MPPLGFARLRIDDEKPSVGAVVTPHGDTVRGESEIEIEIGDDGPLTRATLVVEFATSQGGSESEAVRVVLEPTVGPRRATVTEMLAEHIPGASARGRGRVFVEAVDAAGNLGRSRPVAFQRLDVRAPSIESVVGASTGTGLVTWTANRAQLRFRVSEGETGLAIEVEDPSTHRRLYRDGVTSRGGRIDFSLPVADEEHGLEDGVWRFWLIDPAGNTSAVHEESLEFTGRDPGGEWSLAFAEEESTTNGVGTKTAHATLLADVLVTDGGAVPDLVLACNPVFRPAAVTLRSVESGEDRPNLVRFAEAPSAGSARISIDSLTETGQYEIVVSLGDEFGERTLDLEPLAVAVLAEPIEVTLPPAASSARFLIELLEDSCVESRSGGLFGQGASWTVRPAFGAARYVRGSFWLSIGESSVEELSVRLGSGELSAAVDDREAGGEQLLPVFPVGRGWHRVSTELVDVFGRPVRVFRGEERAPPAADGAPMRVECFSFFHHDEPFRAVRSAFPVERGVEVRVELETNLPLRLREDTVAILLGDSRIVGVEAPNDGGASGARLRFDLPYRLLREPAGFATIDDRAWTEGCAISLPVFLDTPAGRMPFELELLTTRTTLTAARLGEVFGPGASTPNRAAAEWFVEGPLAELELVPILAPGLGAVFQDPVPRTVSRRASFRPLPPIAVANVEDFYLQSREISTREYLALVGAWERVADTVPETVRDRIVHHDDPLGAGRLSRAGLMPEREARSDRAMSQDAPVRGVTFFQAHAASRLLGWLLARDPDMFRLPTGTELEIGGFGRARTGRSGEVRLRAGSGPPEVDADRVETELGHELRGLDFGVREWVLDLPCVADRDQASEILREWIGDHARQLQRIAGFAAGEPMPASVRTAISGLGVVRGFGDEELRRLIADRGPGSLGGGPGFPGVVRTLYLRRDGRGLLPDDVDPFLRHIGFRLAGGSRFVDWMRQR